MINTYREFAMTLMNQKVPSDMYTTQILQKIRSKGCVFIVQVKSSILGKK